MGLKYYSNELNNYGNILPLSSDIDLSLYANTCVSYNQNHQPLSSEISIIKKYTNTYNSIQKNIYANIPKQSPYGTLINTTTFKVQTLDENNNNQLYENFKLHPTSSVSPSLSSHIYINLQDHEDEPPVIPTSILKIDQKEDVSLSSIDRIEIKEIDIETNVLEKRSNIKTKQTVKKSEINMAPNCRDKSDLYRTKIPSTITRIHPSIRQRRTLHCSRRHRRRSSTHIRTTMHSNAIRRQQQQHSNQTITHNRRKRSSHKSIYNRIQQPIVYDNQSMNSFYTEEIFECPKKFHGALQNEIVSWYSAKTELVPQVFSTSENGESVHQDETTNEEEEELCPHDTFEDFLLRRRPKSSCSTLASVTNTLVSEEVPVRPPPLKRPSPGVSLSLDKKDVDFIHEIIQRSHGDQRVSNRITALREAYVRAADKRNDLLKTKKIPQIDQNKNKEKPSMKHSIIASKIRDELEKYDELPVHRKPSFDDDDTYSINENYRYHHHRKLPPVPSTTNRIINFVTTLKRQLQKNFHEIRSRVIIEMMSKPSQNRPIFHNSSSRSHRQRSQIQPKASYTNSRYSTERSYPSHRHQFSRTYSDTSQIHSDQRLSHRPRTFRVTPHLPRRQRMN